MTEKFDSAVFSRLMGWYNRFKQRKACKEKIDEKLLPVAWHSAIV